MSQLTFPRAWENYKIPITIAKEFSVRRDGQNCQQFTNIKNKSSKISTDLINKIKRKLCCTTILASGNIYFTIIFQIRLQKTADCLFRKRKG